MTRTAWILSALAGAVAVGAGLYFASGGTAKAGVSPVGTMNQNGFSALLDANNAGPIPITVPTGQSLTISTPPGGQITTVTPGGGLSNATGQTTAGTMTSGYVSSWSSNPLSPSVGTISVSWTDGGGTPHSTIYSVTVK